MIGNIKVTVRGDRGDYDSFNDWRRAEGCAEPLRFVALPTDNKSALDTRYRLDHLIDGVSRIYKLDNVCAATGEPQLPFEINIPIVWPNSNYNDMIRLQFKTAETRDSSYEWIVRLLNGVWEPLIARTDFSKIYDEQIR